MHVVLVISGGLLLLAVFSLFGWLWGHDLPGVARGGLYFLPVWAAVALTNLWVGVTKAGYSLQEELPIFALVLAVPAVAALLLAWQLAKA